MIATTVAIKGGYCGDLDAAGVGCLKAAAVGAWSRRASTPAQLFSAMPIQQQSPTQPDPPLPPGGLVEAV